MSEPPKKPKPSGEFLPHEVMKRALQFTFKKLNPDADPDAIDWESEIDDSEDLGTNLLHFAEVYPTFIWSKEELPEDNPLVQMFKIDVQTARDVGITDQQIISALRRVGLDLQRPTSAGLIAARKEIEKLKAEVEELKRKLSTATVPRAPPPPPEPTYSPALLPLRPERFVPIPESLTEDNVDALFARFKNIVTTKMKRDLNAAEINQFEDLISTLRKQKPAPSLSQARTATEGLARSIAAIGTSGRIIIRRGQARINALLEKMIESGLTPDEENELNMLRSGAMTLPEEELLYIPPRIIIMADGGPWPPPYPREMGRYHDRPAAEQNADFFRQKGFQVRVVEE